MLAAQDDPHRLGRGAPHLLVRRLQCTKGTVDAAISYAPRPEYGLITPLLSVVDGGVTARGGAEWLVLSTPIPLELDAGTARGRVSLRAGDDLHFALHRSTLEQTPARVHDQAALATGLAE